MSRIRIAGTQDQPLWDDFVLSQGQGGPYHLFAWKRAVEQSYHHETRYILSESDQGTVLGVLPLVLIKPPLLSSTLVSLPFCDYGGVLSPEREVSRELLEHASAMAASLNARLELRYREPAPEVSHVCGLGMTSQKARMLLDLPGDSDQLWGSFKSKLRSQIRRPQKDGLTFTMGSHDLLDDFYTVFRVNMRRLGSPVHARAWIESVLNAFNERARVGVVYSGDNPAAAGIILICRDTATVPWASALSEYARSSPNMLLYWGFLQHACACGCSGFDFGRSTPGEGTYRFKEQWGARPSPLYWYGKGLPDSGVPAKNGGNLRKRIESVWSTLPQGVVDHLGPLVRKYIPL